VSGGGLWCPKYSTSKLITMNFPSRRKALISGLTVFAAALYYNYGLSRMAVANEEGGIPEHLKDVNTDAIDWKKQTEEYWRTVLTPDQYSVCRGAATERPFSGKYCQTQSDGDYHCYCCGQKLFAGASKFDSGTGWPSFSDAAVPGSILELQDRSHGMIRTEVRCARCNAHLGHLFDDGPPPTGRRFCINSICLYRNG